MRLHSLFTSGFLGLLASLPTASAETAPKRPFLDPLFTDHAVLQRDRPVPVWGWAAPGTEVKVTYAGRTAAAKARADDGLWVAQLPAEPAGGARPLLVEGGSAPVKINVLRGDVWLCSGQSNMAFSVKDAADKDLILADPVPDKISLFNVPVRRALRPGETISAQWSPATSDAVLTTTAVGYVMARELHRSLGVPIGIIKAAQGGTTIDAWMSESEKPLPAPGSEEEKAALAHPSAPPTAHYVAMIEPLQPFPLAGVIWYQGEQNVGTQSSRYAELITTLIREWRAGFRRDDLPFVIVQLPDYIDNYPMFAPWSAIREGQRLAVEANTFTGLVPTIDLGDPRDIHPKKKQQVGWRAAQVALKVAYGRTDVEASGPIFDHAEFAGNDVKVFFKNLGQGLAVKGRMPFPFEIAGADGKWALANTKIEDNVVIASGNVNNPTQVRYAWANAPIVTLYGKNGWPVAPFTSVDHSSSGKK